MENFRFPVKKYQKNKKDVRDKDWLENQYKDWLENQYKFLKKDFHQMSVEEKNKLKKDAHGGNAFYFNYMLEHPERFSLKEVCEFIDLHEKDESLYVCFKHALDNRDHDEKDQTKLLEPIKYFVEERHVDLNRPFVNMSSIKGSNVKYDNYPLQQALYWHMPEYVIKYLLDHGANPANCHEECLNAGYFGLVRGMMHLFDTMLLSPSQPFHVNPLMYCCYWNIAYFEGVKWCLDRGYYSPNVFGKSGKYSTFGNLITISHGFAKTTEKRKIIRYLLQNGGNVNLQNDDGDTMLHQYCKEDGFEFGSMIIQQPGINFLIKNNNSRIPLEELFEYYMKDDEWDKPFINPNFLIKLILKTHIKNIGSEFYRKVALCLIVIKQNNICGKGRYNWLNDQLIDEIMSYYIKLPKLQSLCLKYFGYSVDIDPSINIDSEVCETLEKARDEANEILEDKKIRDFIKKILEWQPLRD